MTDSFTVRVVGSLRPQLMLASALLAMFAMVASVSSADTYVANAGSFDPANPVNGAVVTWTGDHDGRGPVANLIFGTDAFVSIQAAVDAASSGGTVLIASVTYDESMEISIAKSLTLQGDGATTTTITGGGMHRVFDIIEGAFDVDFRGVTIADGQTVGSTSERSGGGIRSATTGTVKVMDCTLTQNSAGNGMGIFGGVSGGGIWAFGDLVVENSTLAENQADNGGGGIHGSGNVTVIDSTLSRNDVHFGSGGGISASGHLTVFNCSLTDNVVGENSGGAIAASGDVTIAHSTLSGNTAMWVGGGIAKFSSGTVTITNSTISKNFCAFGGGGGIYSSSTGDMIVANSTVALNRAPFDGIGGGIYNAAAGTVSVMNSIVAGNLGFNPDLANSDVAGAGFSSNGANFIGVDTSTGNTFTNAGDRTFANTSATVIGDVLLPLADNGGPTMTHALALGSPAVNIGDNNDIPADLADANANMNVKEPVPFDQRGLGFQRIFAGFVDAGAIESPQLTTPSLNLVAQNAVYSSGAYSGATASIIGAAGAVDPVDVVLEYYRANDPIPENSIPTPVNVGAYWVRAVFGGNVANNPVATELKSFEVTPVSLIATGTAADKVYDGTTDAAVTISLEGVLGNDVVTGSAIGTFSDKNVGVDKTVIIGPVTLAGTDAGNYSVGSVETTSANITHAMLTALGTAADKVYDGTTDATLSISLAGILEGDVVTGSAVGTFSDKSVGTDKIVTIGPVTLAGTDADNYSVGSAGTPTANITPAALTAMGIAADKVYDGTTDATVTISLEGVLGNDVVTGSAIGTFSDKNVGADKTVIIGPVTLAGTDAGNYSVGSVGTTTANICAAAAREPSIHVTTSGFLLMFYGIPGNTYIIQYTANLAGTWQELIGPVSAGPTGLIEHEDRPVPLPMSRFYRAISSP